MIIPPNPARFIELNPKVLAKKGLFINPEKLQSIRKAPVNSLSSLMLETLTLETSRKPEENLSLKDKSHFNRGTFNAILPPIFLYLLENDKPNLRKASKQLNQLINNLHKTNYNPLDTCHMLITTSLLYHWLQPYLNSKQKKTIEKYIKVYATYLYSTTKTPMGYWAGTPLHNITHCAWAGIGIAGFAFSHIFSEAKHWLNDAFHFFNLVSWLQAEDGTLIEGASYSAYETEMRALFYHLSLELLGEDLYRPSHLGIADFYEHLHKPTNDPQNHIFPWGDSSKTLNHHSPVTLLLSLASKFKSQKIQSQAYNMLKTKFTQRTAFEWMNIVFYNPQIKHKENHQINTDQIFKDLGLISSRDNWSTEATALSFKCGPYQGLKAKSIFEGDPGGSHCHADNASLQLYGKQTDLLIDPGYEAFKTSRNHNTVTINGFGQLGESTKWFKVNHALHYGQTGEIKFYKSTKKYTCWIADASKTYLPNAKLKSYLRTVIFLKPNIVLVLDELETEVKSNFQIYWHTPLHLQQKKKDQIIFQNEKAKLVLDFFAPQTPTKAICKRKIFEELMKPATHTYCTIENKTKSKTFTCLSAFSISEPKETVNTQIQFKQNQITAKDKNTIYKIDLKKNNKITIIAKKVANKVE